MIRSTNWSDAEPCHVAGRRPRPPGGDRSQTLAFPAVPGYCKCSRPAGWASRGGAWCPLPPKEICPRVATAHIPSPLGHPLLQEKQFDLRPRPRPASLGEVDVREVKEYERLRHGDRSPLVAADTMRR